MWQQWPARKLVEIDLNGTLFYLDLRLWECRAVQDFTIRFSLDEIEHQSNGLQICFDPKTRNVFRGDREEYALRKNELLKLQLPTIRELDPIGFQILNGLTPTPASVFKTSMEKGPTKAELLPKKRNRKQNGKHL